MLLLDRLGELRTREELRQQLWPDNTFVDFEHSLNKAIHALRRALGDSATNPRYIETIVGQGYRFIPLPQVEAPPARRSSRTRKKLESLAVMPFACKSNEPDLGFLGDQLASRLINTLSTVCELRVLAWNTVKHCGSPRLQPQIAARNLGVSGLVAGEIGRHDDDLFFHVELIHAADGTQLWGMQLKHGWSRVLTNCEDIAAAISRDLLRYLTPTKSRSARGKLVA